MSRDLLNRANAVSVNNAEFGPAHRARHVGSLGKSVGFGLDDLSNSERPHDIAFADGRHVKTVGFRAFLDPPALSRIIRLEALK